MAHFISHLIHQWRILDSMLVMEQDRKNTPCIVRTTMLNQKHGRWMPPKQGHMVIRSWRAKLHKAGEHKKRPEDQVKRNQAWLLFRTSITSLQEGRILQAMNPNKFLTLKLTRKLEIFRSVLQIGCTRTRCPKKENEVMDTTLLWTMKCRLMLKMLLHWITEIRKL